MTDPSSTNKHGVLECVAFTVNSQIYCLDIMAIREIRRWATVTTLPHAGEHVLGVINLRGNVIPVYDLAVHIGLGKTAPDARNVVIIADIQGESIGLLVESVSEILTVDQSDVQETPQIGRGRQSNLIEGLITVGTEMAQLIDLNYISRDKEEVAA